MRRREFIMFAAGAATYPLGASAQGDVRRIGALAGGKASDPESQASYQKLRQRRGELGWEQGRNIHIEYRWWAGDPNLADAQAAELVDMRPDVLLAISTPSVEVFRRRAPTLPIVFTVVADPVGAGFVQSLGKPGGNITGFTTFEPAMAGKWLQLLKQAAPAIRRVAAVFNPRTAPMILMPSVEAFIPAVQLQLVPAPAHNAAELEQAISRFAEEPNEFQFLLNLKTASALGLSLPPTLVAQADQIIE
ncbi:ABC transporter substrate-binding protein [Bradyrhizobium diversitatis]|uniref:ABC transporter substrate-binding protein n=1 Tax=Bradyrhizobium diversitatis TaxID=2755406 RepID=A0ABS0P3F3_9BRAD|nr:ABC transporter substrate-binding protein [Bradyrhizobium diversitatis]MBH5387800.1 ABC transporter substrate-binding protein [Bradyrhizobium diversitatis]